MSRRSRESTPVLPSVNLLSQSEFDRLSARRLRGRFVAGAIALAVLVGGGWGVQHMRVDGAQKLVDVEQSKTSRLTAQTQLLAPVRAYVNGVQVQERTVADAMATEAYVSKVLDGIREAMPLGAEPSTVSVTLIGADTSAAGTTAAACPGPDPFNTRVVIGCVALSGTASSRAEVGDLVVALGDSNLFVEPFISTTTTDDSEVVMFSGSVGLSEKVFSGRYAEPQPDATTDPAADPAADPATDAATGGAS